MQLKQNPPSSARRRASRAIVALLACAGVMATVAARADSVAASGDYELAVQFADNAGSTAPPIPVKAGEPLKLNWKQPGLGWTGEFVITPAKADSVFVKMKITQENGEQLAPVLMMRLGESGAVTAGKPGGPSFKVGLTVTRPAAKPADA